MHDSTFYLPYIEHYASRLRNAAPRHTHLPAPPLSKANSASFILLYTSHFLQTFGDRLWQFAVPLLFTELFINTLFPQALFTFFTYLSVFFFMPLFGAWIDTTNRLYVVTTTIWAQNVCIVISCVIMFILGYYHEIIISHHSNIHNIDYKLILSFTGLLITSMIGQVMGRGATLSLEKDWVVVLCTSFNDTTSTTNQQNTNNKLLTIVNARMRRIDLFCKIMAPAFFGIYSEYLGNTSIQKVYYGTMIILLWNIIGLVLEWISIKLLYNQNHTVLSLTNNRGKKAKKDNAFVLIYRGWSAYSKSSVLFASVAYCMLYVNVLSGGVLVTAYLKFKGISYLILGVTKGFGAVFGILGTLLTPFLHNKLDLSMELIGIITIWLFWFALIPVGIGDIIIGEYAIALPYIMLCCMIVARMGLWSFDLSINQLMQIMVNDSIRAQVNGTQVALCQIFYMVSSILTMVYHRVDEFFIVVWVTEITLLIACIVYSLWYIFPCCRMGRFASFFDQVCPLERLNNLYLNNNRHFNGINILILLCVVPAIASVVIAYEYNELISPCRYGIYTIDLSHFLFMVGGVHLVYFCIHSVMESWNIWCVHANDRKTYERNVFYGFCCILVFDLVMAVIGLIIYTQQMNYECQVQNIGLMILAWCIIHLSLSGLISSCLFYVLFCD